ncbi:putative salicylate carboxymethyltransferase [Helianthus annuus]|nr:putative salicylate carboxymethyltransferase [Helianthus annuus]
MSIEAVFHMNTGNGDSSYASNSHLQGTGLQRSLPVLQEAINRIAKDLNGFPRCFKIADLGCSSGPNTLFVVTSILDIVHDVCSENNSQVPQFQVFLNDLVENDFNTVFRSLPAFYSKLKKKGDKRGPCYVYAVPGSFYSRLFPDENIHLFHSSYAVHWLSRVPQGLENNKLNIYMAKTSPTNVFEAYRKQFENDFTKLLVLRSHEMISGGHMILTFAGRSKPDPTSEDCCVMWELLAKSLVDMVKECLVEESKVSSFNIPHYTPYEDEVRDVIQKEGSFSLHSVNGFTLSWPTPGINTAKFIRAISEPLIATHFGSSIMDVLFKKYQEHVVDHLATKKGMNYNLIISLIKK